MRKYYEAYDDRYIQVHEKQLQWASDVPSDIVTQVMVKYHIGQNAKILELGCGEGRDAMLLLRRGYNLTATDISPEAVRYCREKLPEFSEKFQVLDCVGGAWEEKYDFIYAVAVVHMLVEEGDRAAFYRFIQSHLKENGLALVCTMGDGAMERSSDPNSAFDLQMRTHGQSGKQLMLAGTSCRMVTWDKFLSEIRSSGLVTEEYGLTEVPPEFSVMMYAVVKKC